MIINIPLLKELFRGFTVQRWNDKIRPLELVEMDKHAHKMLIAYCLGKYEESKGKKVFWNNIIKGGIYELLRRIVISDIKSPIYNKIRNDYKDTFLNLSHWVFNQLEPRLENDSIRDELFSYLTKEDYLDELSRDILEAAHKYASYLEFSIIKSSNPNGFQINEIEMELMTSINQYTNLEGIVRLLTKRKISDFVDLFGQLRFQTRWSQSSRLPKTSVLGHSMFVASLSYFFARENHACDKRLYNDFFGGLFHDLPEAVTRDIISPVKQSSKEFYNLIRNIEIELAQNEIYPLVEESWIDEIKYFTRNEFDNKIVDITGEICSGFSIRELNEQYNVDRFNPIDGELIRAADQLAAFMEAWYSKQNGINIDEFSLVLQEIKANYSSSALGHVNIKSLLSGF